MHRLLYCGLLVGWLSIVPPARGEHPLNSWVKQSPREGQKTPNILYEGSGAYSPDQKLWIHFGGHDGIPQGFYLFTCDVEQGIWRQRFPNTSPPGVCCVDGSNCYDDANLRFVAFPGASLGHGYQWSRGVKLKQSNVWLYDPAANRWTNMRPPPYREPEKYSREIIGSLNSGAAYDPNHEVSFAFGGQGSGGSTNALWVYDAYANRLEHLQPPDPPEPRDGMGMCYDAAHDCLVMFGSQYGTDERTWLYRPRVNRWEAHDLRPHPAGKKEGTYATIPRMAYDSANRICLCVVRRDSESGQPLGTLETWALDVEKLQWTKLEPKVVPDPSSSRARNLSYSAEQNLFILESVGAEKRGMQIWTYRYADRAKKELPAAPRELAVTTQPNTAVLNWKMPGGVRAAGFKVYRAMTEEVLKADFALVGQTKELTFEDQELKAGGVYLYRVTTLNDAGRESPPSNIARTQPRVLEAPIVMVQEADRIPVVWKKSLEQDVVGYNLYRGKCQVSTVKGGSPGPWKDNDPNYGEPLVVSVADITDWVKISGSPPHDSPNWADLSIDLAKRNEGSGDYRLAVYAYVVRAVNRLGTESGPSPYALTIPAAPEDVLLREVGETAEIKWRETPLAAAYHIYKLGKGPFDIVRVTEKPIKETTFRHEAGKNETRYWIVPVDKLGQEGEPSSPVWYRHKYDGFFAGEWHQ